MRAHLRVENLRGEVVLDEDVNDFRVDHAWLQWRTWEQGQKSNADEHEIRLGDLAKVEVTPCQDRLKRETEDLIPCE